MGVNETAMEMAWIAGIAMIILSVLLLVWSFLAYAKHRMTENFGMIWGTAALCLLVTGIVLLAAGQSPVTVFVIVIFLGILLVLGLFGFSIAISILIMKNQELAMHVSLLNQENESILQELAAKKEKDGDE